MKRYAGRKTASVILSAALIIGTLQPIEISAKDGIKLSASAVTLTTGKMKTVKVKGTGKVNWLVSGKAIRVINKGKKSIRVKGMKAGKATIVAKIRSKKYTCKVNVTAARNVAGPTTAPSKEPEAIPTAAPTEKEPASIRMVVQEYRSDTNTITIGIENNTSGQVVYGRMFRLEKYENGKWTTVPFLGDIMFTADAIMLPPNGKSTEAIPLDNYFGVLSTGKYRILRTVYSDALSKSGIVLSVDFEIVREQAAVSAEPVQPTEAPIQPTMTPIQPTMTPAQPTEAPIRPTMAPAQPTETPIQVSPPTMAPVQPTEAPIQVSPLPTTTYQPEQFIGEIPLYRGLGNGEKAADIDSRVYSMMRCLPVGLESRIISDVQDLEEVERAFYTIATNCIHDPVNHMLMRLATYDEEYFQENSLVLGTYERTYGYSVLPEQVIVDGDKLICKLQLEWTPKDTDVAVPDVMMNHVILNEIPKSEVEGCSEVVMEPEEYSVAALPEIKP